MLLLLLLLVVLVFLLLRPREWWWWFTVFVAGSTPPPQEKLLVVIAVVVIEKAKNNIFCVSSLLSCGVLVEEKEAKKRDFSLFFSLFLLGGCFSVEEDISPSLSSFWISLLKISPSFSLFSLSETRVVPSYFPRRTFTFTFKTHKFYHHYVIGCE